jgi:hypothetical protein
MGILEDQTVFGLMSEGFGDLQESFRIGLAALDLVAAHHHGEPIEESVTRQALARFLGDRRRADAAGDVSFGRPLQCSENPRLQGNALGRDDRFIAGARVGTEPIQREAVAEMRDQTLLAVGDGDADERQVELVGEIEAERSAAVQDRL